MQLTSTQTELLISLANRMERKQVLSKEENLLGAALLKQIVKNKDNETSEKLIDGPTAQKKQIANHATRSRIPLKRGDVISVEYQHKNRPGLIIKISKGYVYVLLLSSELDSPYKLMDGNSRIFGRSTITHTLIPLQMDYAEENFLCQYDNQKLVVEATKAYNKHIAQIFAPNIKGVKVQEQKRVRLKIA